MINFVIGLFSGAAVGFFVAALCASSKREELEWKRAKEAWRDVLLKRSSSRER